jgi:Holliday junction DNA helicase RuvA
VRKALRAMSAPVHQIAAAIQRADPHFLTSLPEIGKQTAAQIVVQLRGKLERFCRPSEAPTPAAEMTEAQRVALEILVQWGDRRADAQRWIAAAVKSNPDLADPEDIVRAAYKARAAGGA